MVAGQVTLQGKVPVSGVLLMMVVQVVPPFRDSSILTGHSEQVDVQVMFCVVPPVHDSPPLGEVTVIVGWLMGMTTGIMPH